MTRKISAFGTLTGAGVDSAADYLPIVDVSVADASKNKKILVNELATVIGTGKLSLSGGTMTGAITLAGDPASAFQAATKQYVDGIATNIGKRQTVRVAATGNVVVSTGLNSGDVLDGVTLATNDLVLLPYQSTPAQNGIYVVDVTPVRTTAFDTYDEHPGALIAVSEGTANAHTSWLCTSNAGGTLNTTAITFTQQSTSGALLAGTATLAVLNDVNISEGAGIDGYSLTWHNATARWIATLASGATYAAGTGITLTGVTFSIDGSVVALLASPTFTGTPAAPTASAGTNTTQLATTAFVKAAIDVVLGGVSFAFDTLSEIATALAGKLTASNNLSDVGSASTARGNLGLGTIATFPETTTAQYLANTSGKALSTDKVWAAADYVALTDASTVALDMATFINGTVTLAGNRTLGNPSNTKNGQTGVIEIKQDGTGTRTLAYSSNWKFAAATAPVLSTAAGTRDLLFYQVISSTVIYGTLVKGVA